MKFMVEWDISCDDIDDAVEGFLELGAPMPEGLELHGRWHGPGSKLGWLLVETDHAKALYEHIAEWSSLLDFNVTPVIEDAEAAEVQVSLRVVEEDEPANS